MGRLSDWLARFSYEGSAMNRRELMWRAGATAMTVALPSCDTPSLPYRYRMTVNVETPQGVRSGSSVIEVDQGDYDLKVRGEAVAVVLPRNEVLFCLLAGVSGGPAYFAELAYKSDLDRRFGPANKENRPERLRALTQQSEPVRLPRIIKEPNAYPFVNRLVYPQFARFRSLVDPASVEWVDPDHLDDSFGKGHRLDSIVIQITRDGITHGIEKYLPWLPRLSGRNLDGTRISSSLAPSNMLRASHFLEV